MPHPELLSDDEFIKYWARAKFIRKAGYLAVELKEEESIPSLTEDEEGEEDGTISD